MIRIEFPNILQLYTTIAALQSYYVSFGIDDISEDNPVSLTLEGLVVGVPGPPWTYLTISNFKAITGSALIGIRLRLQNSNTDGDTTSLKINTYGDSDRKILFDNDDNYAITTILNYGCLSFFPFLFTELFSWRLILFLSFFQYFAFL